MTDTLRWGDLLVTGGDRRQEIRRRHRNGVDAVEVREHGRRLAVTFLEQAPGDITPANVRIDPPPHGSPVVVLAVRLGADDDNDLQGRLVVELERPGGHGRYQLRMVERGPDGRPGRAPYRGIDPRFAGASFAFSIDAPNPVIAASPALAAAPGPDAISYLARDFNALCLMLLDRLAQTIPEWTERHVPDIGISLIELLAYEGDDLSYYQDAVATEAYLQTARRRISVRRHARLAGYRLHEGCNARAWVCLEVDEDLDLPLTAVAFATLGGPAPGAAPVTDLASLPAVPASPIRLFTPMRPPPARPGRASPADAPAGRDASQPVMPLRHAHNRIGLWSWGERSSWLAAGATSAVLADEWAQPPAAGRHRGRRLDLQRGDALLLEEISAPDGTGPADPAHRHPVRLTAVSRRVDELYDQPIVQVCWAAADALPFRLRVTAPGPAGSATACTVARANVVLADHGAEVAERVTTARPALSRPGLSHACPFPGPALVGRSQARQLRGLFRAWRQQTDRWRRAAEQGQPLSEDQIAELANLLGGGVIEELRGPGSGDARQAESQASALSRLLIRSGRLLAGRIRRVHVLAALADASGPLERVYLDELAEDWGQHLISALDGARPAAWGPAAAIRQDPRAALPLLELTDVALAGADAPAGNSWSPVLDLLDSDPGSRDVVVEIDDNGIGHLRFAAAAPLPPSGAFTARYRVGNGADGNVPAESINTVVWLGAPGVAGQSAAGRRGTGSNGRPQSGHGGGAAPAAPDASSLAPIVGVRNPLAAAGGTAAESMAAAKLAVPGAYLVGQPRALSAADYAALAQQVQGVARAAARLCWTGYRLLADVAVQPSAGEDPQRELLEDVHAALWPARRIGHDLRVGPPRYRALIIGAQVTITADARRADVAAELTQRLSSGWLPDGSTGLFNPQRLGFGAPVYASAIISAAQAAPGVIAVVLERLCFVGDPEARPSAPAPAAVPDQLEIGPMEIARLDNDPDAPQHGWATITLAGGR